MRLRKQKFYSALLTSALSLVLLAQVMVPGLSLRADARLPDRTPAPLREVGAGARGGLRQFEGETVDPENIDEAALEVLRGRNLVLNPSFEETEAVSGKPFKGELQPKDWTNTWCPAGKDTNYSFQVIDDGSGENHILEMASQDADTPVRLFLGQDIAIADSSIQLILSYLVKTEELTGETGAFARLTWYSDPQQRSKEFKLAKPDEMLQTEYLEGTNEWTRVTEVVTVPAEAKGLRFQLANNNKSAGTPGSVWFDDVILAPVTPYEETEEPEEPEGGDEVDLTGASETVLENNLVLNPGFEETEPGFLEDGYTGLAPTLWSKTWIPKGADTNYSLQVIDDGSGSNNILEMKSDGTKALRAALDQDFALEDPTKAYQFRFDMKTVNIVGGSGTRARISWFDATGKQISYLESSSKFGSTGWASYKMDIPAGEVPAGTKTARVALFTDTSGQGTTGAVYFDSIYFGPDAEDAPETPSEEGFVIDQTPEEDMILAADKIHVPKMRGCSYTPEDENVAKNDRGFIVPVAAGETRVRVTNEKNEEVHSFKLTVEEHAENNFDRMREQWAYIQAGNEAFDPNEPKMVENFQGFEEKVETYMTTANMASDRTYIWDSHKFEGVADRAYSVSLRYGFLRLEEMARAVSNERSAYYMNVDVIRFIKDNVKWLYDHHYHRDLPVTGNWWNYEIGASRHINNMLCYLYPFFTDEEVENLTDAVNYYVPDPGYSQATIQGPRVNRIFGANQVDIGMVKLIGGVLREDNAQMKEASEAIADVLPLVTSGNGFYPDGSYLDHGNKNSKPVAYNGAYGLVLIDGLSKVVPIIQMSDNPWDASDLDIVYFWFQEAYFPLMYKGEFMDMTRGRSKSRVKEQPHDKQIMVFRPGLRIANMGDGTDPRQIAMKEIIKSQVLEDSYFDVFGNLKGYSDFAAMKELLADESISGITRDTYIKLYNSMDKFVAYNADRDFAIGISMHSDETQNYEDMNDENRQGWYEGDGMFYLYNGDLAHYSGDYRPTVDPYRFPGTTVLTEVRADGSGETNLPSAFVGMTNLGNDQASVAMDFSNWNRTLTAKKAWFVFGDKIVFLGGEIAGPAGSGIETTIENRKVSDVSYDVYVDGAAYLLTKGAGESTLSRVKSIFLEGPAANLNIGYAFLEDTDVSLCYENRQSSWSKINYGQSADPVDEDFITFWQKHDADKNSYAYVLYPNHTRDEFTQRTANQSVKVLRNDASVQAVYDADKKAWGIVKYDDEGFALNDEITLKKAGIYTIREQDDGSFALSYVDPVGQQDIAEANFTLSDKYEASFVPSPGLEDISSQATLSPKQKPSEPSDPTVPTEPADLSWLETTAAGGEQTVAEPETPVWLKGSAEALVFKANGELEDLLSVKLDGETIFRAGDPLKTDLYQLEKGSTILRLHPAGLNKLAVGAHTLEMNFKEGNEVKGGVLNLKFVVSEKQPDATTRPSAAKTEPQASEPGKTEKADELSKTGESFKLPAAGMLLVLTGLLLAGIVLYRNRRRRESGAQGE